MVAFWAHGLDRSSYLAGSSSKRHCLNTVRWKCEYGALFITNAREVFKSRVEENWFEDFSSMSDEQNTILTFPSCQFEVKYKQIKSLSKKKWWARHNVQKSILSLVTTLIFVVTSHMWLHWHFLANVTVNHNVHTFTVWRFVPQFPYQCS